jgi:fructose-bisphosphate aldolase, class II
VEAAEAAASPVILQISQNAVKFHGYRLEPITAATAAVARSAAVPVSLHLDHVEAEELLKRAAASGFSSVMFDAGSLGYHDNVERTSAAAAWAHSVGLWLEAELGYIGGKPDAPASAHAAGVRTDPGEARDFVAATGVDALAVAVGSSHAMTSRTARIDPALVAAIHASVPVPLVLHGSSGVPDAQLRTAIRAGISKVNIGTAINAAMTSAIRDALCGDPAKVDPRTYLSRARTAMAETAQQLIRVIASAGG